MNIAWTKIREERIACGYRKILRKTFQLPDGNEDVFDILDEGHTVSILALTSERQVVIARPYRPGPEIVVNDLPCGAIEQGESVIDAAHRELLEETGYAGEFREIGVCLESPCSNKIRHNFVAVNCKRVQEPTPDATEFIDPVLMSLSEFRDLLRSGQLTVVETGYIGLDVLNLL